MAKPFQERAAAALKNSAVRTTELEQLIAEGTELAEVEHATATQAAAESIDYTLAEADRDDAAARAQRAARTGQMLVKLHDDLSARLAERQASDSERDRQAEKRAALAERDALVEQWQAARAVFDNLVTLFWQTQANERRMREAGLRNAPNAELHARGFESEYRNCKPVDLYLKMKIPGWHGGARAWPLARYVDDGAGARQARLHLAAHDAAEREAAWGQYRVHPLDGLSGGVTFKHRAGETGQAEATQTIYTDAWTGQMRHTEAKRLQKAGVEVDALEPVEAAE